MTEFTVVAALLIGLGAMVAALCLKTNPRRSAILQVVMGVVAVLTVWRPTYGGGFRSSLALMAGELTFNISPRAFGPLLIFGALMTYSISGSASTLVLLSAVAIAMGVVGIVLPLFVRFTALWRPEIGAPESLVGTLLGLRGPLAEIIGILAGIYLALLVYHTISRRWPSSAWWIRLTGGLLAGHLTSALSVSILGALGTDMWPAVPTAEGIGWTFSAVSLALVAWGTARIWSPDLLGASASRELGATWREMWDLRSVLERTENQLLHLNEQLREIAATRAALGEASDRAQLAREIVSKLPSDDRIAGAVLILLDNGSKPFVAARSGETGSGLELAAAQSIDGSLPAADGRSREELDRFIERLRAELDSSLSSEAVLLLSGDSVWGGIVLTVSRPGQFGIQDRLLLGAVAGDIAYALDHLRLRDRWSRRERELEALRDLNRRIVAERSISSILEQVLATAVERTGASAGAAYALEDEAGGARLVAVTGETRHQGGERFVLNAGDPGEMDNGATQLALAQAVGVELADLYPIEWQGKVQAALWLAPESGQKFDSQASEFLRLLAGQAAAALANARLFEAQLRRSEELEVLREASLNMTSSLELDELLPQILRQALNLANAFDAHIFLYDGERLTFGAAMWSGDLQKTPYSTPRENGLTYTVARSGNRIVVPDVKRHPLYEGTEWTGAIVGIPLTVGQRAKGVMNVAYQEPHAFTPEELRALGLLADQAAVSIEVAELFQRTAADRRRLQLLYDVTRELSATLDPEQIMQRGAELTKDYLRAASGRVYMLDRRTGILQPQGNTAHGPGGEREPGQAVRLGQGFVGWIAQQGKPVRVEDLLADDRWTAMHHIEPQARSAMGVPLTVGGESRGVLAVFHHDPAAFSADQLELLLTISQQIGLAWSNATRYRQVERRLAERTAIQQVAQVVNSRLEMDQLLEEVVNQVSQVLGYPIVDIALVEGGELVVRAAAGLREAGPVRIPLGSGVVGRVARTNEAAFVPDVSQDPDYIPIEAPSTSEIAVPLRKGDVVIGVLNVESHRPADLTEDDLRLLSLVADQVAIAIENSALYERLRQHTYELEKKVADRTGELADALSQAQEADRMKTQFVSDVSHELRTPLSNIRLYLELLDQAAPDRRAVYLETLNRESDRLVTLIEDLLSISRIDSGSLQARYDPLSISELAAELVEDRQRLFAEKGLRLQGIPAPELPQVLGDRRLLAQVLANLMTNALNYTPPGGEVIVKTELSKDGQWVKLIVRDSGLGILPPEREKVFDRFYRGSASREIGNPGTGLGLAISREIITRHRGHITVNSVPGEGSEFQIWLPTAEAFSRPGEVPVEQSLSVQLD